MMAVPKRWFIVSARWFCAGCLGLQILIYLIPNWGYFIPHAHLISGHVTEEDWQAHMQAHRLGLVESHAEECNLHGSTAYRSTADHKIVAVADSDADSPIASVYTLVAWFHSPVILNPGARVGAAPTAAFNAQVMYFPPPDPPPNAAHVLVSQILSV